MYAWFAWFIECDELGESSVQSVLNWYIYLYMDVSIFVKTNLSQIVSRFFT